MTLIEAIAVLFSLMCIILAVKKHVLNWPVGIIGVSAYLILFYRERLYADMILQIVFIIQGIYGWYNWQSNRQNEQDLLVEFLSSKQRTICLLIIGVVSTTWFLFLRHYTNASAPLADAFAATISLAANWLLARKIIESWLLWIIADLVYISLFWYKGLYLSSCIYVLFLFIALKGFTDWIKKRNIQEASF